MKNLYFIFIIFVISSCGGGGGGSSAPTPTPTPTSFSLSIGLTSFSLDEDTSYSGSLNATANETVTLNYSINSSTSNGTLTLSANGGITYNPKSNFFGSDQFEYSVTAVEKNVTKTATVNISINSVNDAPILTITNFEKSNEFVFPGEEILVDVVISDIDSELASLIFSANSLYGDPTDS